MRRLVVLAALLVGACFPAPYDPTGKRCSATRACGEGFFCSLDGLCVEGARENFLLNGSFEDGTAEWTLLPSGTAARNDADAFEGPSSLSVTATAATQLAPKTSPVPSSGANVLYCAAVNLKGTAAARLRIVEQLPDGEQSASSALFSASPARWTRGVVSARATGGAPLTVRLDLGEDGSTTNVLIDAFRLWRSLDGACER